MAFDRIFDAERNAREGGRSMEKIDFKKELADLYKPSSKDFSIVTVPPLKYLMVDGEGDPNTSPEYVAAIEALYGVSYTLKFMSKTDLGQDYVVPPLEGLWWADDMSAFAKGRKASWKWTAMIMVPEWITKAMVKQAVKSVSAKKENTKLAVLRHEILKEGKSVQILHVGPYDKEGPMLSKMHNEFMPAQNLAFNGKHHEIYMSDPRKVAPAKLKTIVRQPVKKVTPVH